MKRPGLVLLILALAAVAFAETNLTGSPGPAAPYVERHSALDKYPFKNDGGDQLSWADFGLKGRVRKMYIETSDVISGTDSLKDHVIVSFDSLGRVETTISDTHSPQPRGFRYLYHPDGKLEKVQRCACQNGLETQTADLDSVYPAQDNAAEYFYDELGKLNRIVFYDDAGAVFKEHLYTYTDEGYSVAINFAVPSRRNRDQIHFYDRKGTPVISQKKDLSGKFITTAKYSYDTKRGIISILQDYLNDAHTQKTTNVLDGEGRLKESTINDFQGNFMRKYTYSYDSEGRLSSMLYNSPNDKINTVHTYITDDLGNLIQYSAIQDKGDQNLSLSIRYEYY